MAHRFKVRLTRMLNTWVEVEADTPADAESKAYNEVIGKGKADPCWSDDDDVQVEDATVVLVNGEYVSVYEAPKECGGMGESPAPQAEV